MNATERYLKAATRGLWGRQRREVRTELQGHIRLRVRELRLGGLSEAQAERQTLRELGLPAEVSAGMLGVHTLSTLTRGGLASLLAATLLVSTLPWGHAQVNGLFGSAWQYVEQSPPTAYLDLTQLQAEVAQAGGRLTSAATGMTITVPGMLHRTVPIQAWPGSTFQRQGHTYIQANLVVAALFNSGLDLRLSGWTNPTVQAGRTTIRIQTQDGRVSNDLYKALLFTRPELTRDIPTDLLGADGETRQVTLKGEFQPGQVYALVTPIFRLWSSAAEQGGKPLRSGNLNFAIHTAVAQSGQVTFRIYDQVQHFKLLSSVEAMHRALGPYRDAFLAWDAEHPAPAVVLALSGHFGSDAYTVVPPQQLRRQ